MVATGGAVPNRYFPGMLFQPWKLEDFVDVYETASFASITSTVAR